MSDRGQIILLLETGDLDAMENQVNDSSHVGEAAGGKQRANGEERGVIHVSSNRVTMSDKIVRAFHNH